MTAPNLQSIGLGETAQDPLADDPELRKELASMFLEDGPKQLAQVGGALNDRNSSALKAAAHKLKGSIGVFKDQAAFEAALRMEYIGRDADWPSAPDAWKSLNAEVTRLLTVLAAFAGRNTAPTPRGST